MTDHVPPTFYELRVRSDARARLCRSLPELAVAFESAATAGSAIAVEGVRRRPLNSDERRELGYVLRRRMRIRERAARAALARARRPGLRGAGPAAGQSLRATSSSPAIVSRSSSPVSLSSRLA